MPDLEPLDPSFPISRQMDIDAAPIVLANLCTMAPEDEAAFLEAWAGDAAFMKSQPGFISTQLHRALGDSPTYLNYAVFESAAAWHGARPSSTRALGRRSRRIRRRWSPGRIFFRRSRCRTCAPHNWKTMLFQAEASSTSKRNK